MSGLQMRFVHCCEEFCWFLVSVSTVSSCLIRSGALCNAVSVPPSPSCANGAQARGGALLLDSFVRFPSVLMTRSSAYRFLRSVERSFFDDGYGLPPQDMSETAF